MSMTKRILLNVPMVVAGDMSANITSKSVEIQYLDNIAISLQFPVNAGATGTFFIDVSNDNKTFIPLGFGSSLSVPDADNAIQIEATQLAASWIRVRYVFISGTGTLNAFISAKEI
jgi:hypothetical protein